MAYLTPNLGLKKPAQTDFYDVDDFNSNMDILDGVMTNLDCGNWDDTDMITAIENHNANPLAHQTVLVDGNTVSTAITAHDTDANAHPTNNIDGGNV